MEREDNNEPSAFASRGFEASTWKSPRKLEEERLNHQRDRFDFYLEMETLGVYTTRQLALTALREELGLAPVDDCQTEPIDTNKLWEMLEDDR